jgi:ectoine hydroxylase-related dioxygenase (phytanoyl-CoA dioxygenase family)
MAIKRIHLTQSKAIHTMGNLLSIIAQIMYMSMDSSNYIKHNTYGVTKAFWAKDDVDGHVEDLYFKGVTIVEDVFSLEQVELAKSKIDDIQSIENASAILTKDDGNIRCPLAYDRFFLDFAYNQKILSIVNLVLGSANVLLMQNGIINSPAKSQFQTRWHRDLNYQHWVNSEPLAINFLIMLDDFTVDNGCTWVLPASHLRAEFPSERYITINEQALIGKAGSVAILDAMLFHRAGKNITKNFKRYALNHVVGKPFLSQQIDIPRFISEKAAYDCSNDRMLSQYLGFQWNPAANSTEWRKKRA